MEIGVGDGTESNTIILIGLGWSGLWLGAEGLAWTPSGTRLTFKQTFVTLENLNEQMAGAVCDVFSVDLDGNDFWITELALETIAPRVLIVEYQRQVSAADSIRDAVYSPQHRWDGSDWFGASLSSWVDLARRARLRARLLLVLRTERLLRPTVRSRSLSRCSVRPDWAVPSGAVR